MKLRRMQTPCIEPLPINDNNKVDDSTITLIVVVEGQDIPNELVFFYANLPSCEREGGVFFSQFFSCDTPMF